MKRGKQAQGLSVNAIILIVLGVVVLGVMILGFTMGWSNFSSYFSGNNVKSISTVCQTACATYSEYDFNTVQRTLKTDEGTYTGTCNELSTGRKDSMIDGQSTTVDIPASDKNIAYNKDLYKIAACPELNS